ncbi:hypothetical protein B0H17DRAFT_1257950 [Mycena rosella]|uniref:CCZ1/INTU/HSP4 first Longin domain-containing protein n=1 Tax=Mycena rosella TaxID=1033263 RepID=A0AAD7DTU3_MYCRO|nr:hypothetical protein B0H17DRAFT_1257950 [Mycena rosella]
MSRIAPNLLYLTIYNPTLSPSGPVATDDEDAEEQAHILFYTSKERAVSRDRMLRQVGLAKALISFSDMFNAEDPCNNVHSQTKRMIMVSPEPNFWIHAGIDVAKTPRPPVEKPTKGKGKEKSNANAEAPVLYDYHEYSVHDIAVKADIMRGYDKFKLRHGSFASVLAAFGQQALELQLERFFTVWAWSWDLEDGPEFGEHLGPPLHPLQNSLLPHLDEFSSRLPDEVVVIAVFPPYVIPSTRYTDMPYPPALPNFLLSLLPPTQHLFSPPPAAADTTIKVSKALPPLPDPEPRRKLDASKHDEDAKTFLGMNLDLNVKMDMPKWNWPGYLTFGKGGKRPPDLLAVTPMNENRGSPQETPGFERTMNFEVDRSALEDAMHSERIPLPRANTADAADGHSISETIVPRKEDDPADGSGAPAEAAAPEAQADVSDEPAHEPEAPVTPEPALPNTPEPEPAEFSATTVHLAPVEDPQATRRRRLYYLVVSAPSSPARSQRDRVLVALVGLDGSDSEQIEPDPAALRPWAHQAAALAETIAATVAADPTQSAIDLLPSATKILQPKDRHALSSSRFTIRSADFESHSGHLYNARQLLADSEPGISEVFSRGQNPQHWHVARRGLGTERGDAADEEVYMEVFRKEASLTDVDNALAGVIRKAGPAAPPSQSTSTSS